MAKKQPDLDNLNELSFIRQNSVTSIGTSFDDGIEDCRAYKNI